MYTQRPINAWRQCSQGICMLCETCGGTRLLLRQTDVQRRERGGEKARESRVLLSRHKYHPKTRLPSAGKSWHVGCHGRRDRRHDTNMRAPPGTLVSKSVEFAANYSKIIVTEKNLFDTQCTHIARRNIFAELLTGVNEQLSGTWRPARPARWDGCWRLT